MALLWVEGFEKFGDIGATVTPSNVSQSKYASQFDYLCYVDNGRYSGSSLICGSTSFMYLTPELNPSRTLIVGLNFKVNTIDDYSWVFDLRHPGNDGETIGYNQFTLRTVQTGNDYNLQLVRGGTGIATSANSFVTGTWYAIELEVYCDSTSGTAKLWVNGNLEIDFSGNTRHRTSSGVVNDRYSKVMLRSHNIPSHSYDDLYVMDDTGNTNNAALNTNWRVECLSPVSDASGNWTPSTGNDAYACVDENERSSDYLSETASGNRVMFEMDNLTANGATGTIHGVVVNIESSKSSRYKKTAKVVTQNGSGGSIQDGRDVVSGLNNSKPVCTTNIMEADPDGNAWTASTVNSLRVGVEVK